MIQLTQCAQIFSLITQTLPVESRPPLHTHILLLSYLTIWSAVGQLKLGYANLNSACCNIWVVEMSLWLMTICQQRKAANSSFLSSSPSSLFLQSSCCSLSLWQSFRLWSTTDCQRGTGGCFFCREGNQTNSGPRSLKRFSLSLCFDLILALIILPFWTKSLLHNITSF